MRCLTIIMMFNLYHIKKLTTINNARVIFLMELKEKTFIDISSHIFDTIVDETRTTSRPKLIFPSLLMRIFRKNGVAIPQDISLMSTPSAINKQTFKRISVRLPSEEDEGEGDPMETEAKAAGQASTSTPGRRGKRTRASLLQIYLQMHFRSSCKDLIDSERSRSSSLRGWQPYRTGLMFFQQNLIALPHIISTDLLVIPIKKGEKFYFV